MRLADLLSLAVTVQNGWGLTAFLIVVMVWLCAAPRDRR